MASGGEIDAATAQAAADGWLMVHPGSRRGRSRGAGCAGRAWPASEVQGRSEALGAESPAAGRLQPPCFALESAAGRKTLSC